MSAKRTPHKHAAIIKAWADGATVEYKPLFENKFYTMPAPDFLGSGEYRVKPDDEYAALKAAADAGKSMQSRVGEDYPWVDSPDPKKFLWSLCVTNYRIKPETVSYRLAILQYKGGPPYACVSHTQADERKFEAYGAFVRWAGDRQTVEV